MPSASSVIESIKMCKILSCRVRAKMLTLLNKHKALCVCEFLDLVGEDISQPYISKNLAILKNEGYITTKKEGRRIVCKLTEKGRKANEVMEFIAQKVGKA